MDPELIFEGITIELDTAINSMKKCKSLEDKKTTSEIIKNLSDSLGVFLNIMKPDPYDDFDEFDDDDEDNEGALKNIPF